MDSAAPDGNPSHKKSRNIWETSPGYKALLCFLVLLQGVLWFVVDYMTFPVMNSSQDKWWRLGTALLAAFVIFLRKVSLKLDDLGL